MGRIIGKGCYSLMNAAQAKQIKLTDLMAKLGYEVKVVERGRTEHKYLSAWRAEVEPSLNVNLVKNQWYDFGDGEGGNTLDFAIAYLSKHGRPSRVTDALQWLEDQMGRPNTKQSNRFSFSEDKSQKTGAPRYLEFVKDSPLRSELILKYLRNRHVSSQNAKKYLRVVQYRNTSPNAPGSLYFGFGQQNISGGWEIRSASDSKKGKFKSALIVRDITVHPGSEQSRGAVSVFEGMLDHLSLLEMMNTDQLRGDAIIMNALSSYNRTKVYIEQQGYNRINLFLDNNASGKKAATKFQEDFEGCVFDQSPLYLPHVDLNDCLRAGDNPFFKQHYAELQP